MWQRLGRAGAAFTPGWSRSPKSIPVKGIGTKAGPLVPD
jgi:hypothetical protein